MLMELVGEIWAVKVEVAEAVVQNFAEAATIVECVAIRQLIALRSQRRM